MLENISLIAAIISGIASITSSLRAVGASRELVRNEAVSNVRTSCRIGTSLPSSGVSQRNNLKLHVFVTAVWFLLSVIFTLPIYSQYWTGEFNAKLLLLISPLIVLAVIILAIWTKVRSNL